MDTILTYKFLFEAMLSLLGFLIARYIYNKKKIKKPLMCPMRGNCDRVVSSKFSKVFGIPLEVLGMLHYLLMIFLFVGIHFGVLHTEQTWVIIEAGFGFLVSLYLIFIQAFVIRSWCTWCVLSAIISYFIFYIYII